MAPPASPRPAREPLVGAPASQGVGGSQESFLKAELRVMWMIGWPMAVSFFCRFAMMSMDAAFVGHLQDGGDGANATGVPGGGLLMTRLVPALQEGDLLVGEGYGTKEYLGGATLSDMVTNIVIIPLMAMATGIGPLVGQAMGAGGSKMAGTWVQLCIFCVTLASVPFHIAFFFVGELLRSLGFQPELCELAGRYAKFSVFWVIPNMWYLALRFYFQAQGLARPAMYVGLLFLGVNALMNYCLVFGGPFEGWLGWPGFGFIGAALSISISRILQCLLYFIYMFRWRRAHLPTWPGWNADFLRAEHMQVFLAQTLPQVGTLLLQMMINQSVTLLVARLGSLAVASSSAATSATIPFTLTFLATLSTLAGIRVGFHLGSGRPDLAKRTAWAMIGVGAAMMLAFALVMVPLRVELMSVITSDEEVRDLAAQILPAVVLNLLAASIVQCGTGGILASQGRTRLSTILSLCFELPLSLGSITALVLIFHADVRIVYWTQAAATVIEALIVLLIVRRSDWDRYAAAAQARQRRSRPQAVGAELEAAASDAAAVKPTAAGGQKASKGEREQVEPDGQAVGA